MPAAYAGCADRAPPRRSGGQHPGEARYVGADLCQDNLRGHVTDAGDGLRKSRLLSPKLIVARFACAASNLSSLGGGPSMVVGLTNSDGLSNGLTRGPTVFVRFAFASNVVLTFTKLFEATKRRRYSFEGRGTGTCERACVRQSECRSTTVSVRPELRRSGPVMHSGEVDVPAAHAAGLASGLRRLRSLAAVRSS